MSEVIFTACFIVAILFLLFMDLGVFHKKDHVVTFKESAMWTGIWVTLAILFFFFIRWHGEIIHDVHTPERLAEVNELHGHNLDFAETASFEDNLKQYNRNLSLEYITGYLIEESLSIDNIFVMIMIFMAFGVDRLYYHRVLFYGILGAIILRFIFIFAAGALIQKFHWLLYVFGVILIFSGVKMFLERNKKETIDVENHPVVKFLSKRKLSTPNFDGHNFFSKIDGRWLCTPLFVVLLIIEFSDIIFAFDSVPAIFTITQDPFIVFFSNLFAILGLRSLFFMFESIMDKFRFLKIGLSVLLTFIGAKMLLPIHIGTVGSLAAIASILGVSVIASLLFPEKKSVTE